MIMFQVWGSLWPSSQGSHAEFVLASNFSVSFLFTFFSFTFKWMLFCCAIPPFSEVLYAQLMETLSKRWRNIRISPLSKLQVHENKCFVLAWCISVRKYWPQVANPVVHLLFLKYAMIVKIDFGMRIIMG